MRTLKSIVSTRSSVPLSGYRSPVVFTACAVALLGLVGCGSSSSSGGFNNGIGGFSGAGSGGSGISTDGGATDAANPGTGGSTGAAGSGGLGGASGVGGATGTGCYVTVTALAPATTVDVEAGKGARMRVEGHAWGTFTPPITWVWAVTVSGTGSTNPISVPTNTLDGTGAVVDFPLEQVGRYRIAAVAQSAAHPDCQTPSPLVISTIAPGPMAYVVRVTASGFPVQEMRVTLDPTDPQAIVFPLQPSVNASLLPLALDTGGSLASYIRISDSASGLSIDADSTHGAVTAPVLGQRAYDVLIVPIDSYAPMYLLNGTPDSWPQPLQLDRGTPVNATMRDGKGNAVVGARLVLRRGSLPSTVGVGDGNGAASLWARAGTLAAYVEPPIGSGLPSASVGAGSDPSTDPGIVLDPGVVSLDLTMTWAPVTSAALSIHVLAPGGAAAGAGARVRATSQGAPGRGRQTGRDLGRRQDGYAAGDRLHRRRSRDQRDWNRRFSGASCRHLRRDRHPCVEHGCTGHEHAGNHQRERDARGGGPHARCDPVDEVHARRHVVAAARQPGHPDHGDRSDRHGSRHGLVGHRGCPRHVSVVRRSGPQLRAARSAAGRLRLRGRAVLASSVSAAMPPMAAAMLPVAHLVPGTVTAETGAPVGGALVQAFCPITSPKCLDATFPLAEAITRADGTFQLTLPDPPGN